MLALFQAIIKEQETYERVLRAYEMMLDFYGLELADKHTGVVIRKEGDWKERFAHFNKYTPSLFKEVQS